MSADLIEEITPFGYRARMDTDHGRIVDGDTVDITVDFGFRTSHDVRVRLDGVNTAETHNTARDSEEFQQGMIHETFVRKWFEIGEDESIRRWPFGVLTEKDKTGKYGRYVAKIVRYSDGNVLNDDIIEAFPDTESEQ